mmetsp:Transcript_131104/g.293288  ORF Transcript_131104/g.293288 Transcript_131104/m.293288 type:complete len:1436 (+) Transcript_131104:3-4310(+)
MMMVGMVASTLVSGERLGAIVAYGMSCILNLLYIGVVGNFGQRIPTTNGAEGPLFSPLANFGASSLFAVSLIPCVGFSLCLKTYFHLDNLHGCTWSTVAHMCEGFYSVGGGMLMLVAAFFLWGLLYVYLDQVVEHDVGTAQPFYFMFKYSYWAETFGWDRVKVRGSASTEIENQDRQYFEEENSENLQTLRSQNKVISVRGLRKDYTNGAGITVPAVNNLNLTMYEGECFCLLGHNGAGKSTTIGMMTGITKPTEGDIRVYGKQVSRDLVAIRQEMGFCMQQNVLWDELLVCEHLLFFCAIAGFSRSQTEAACDQALKKVELFHKRDELASALSGGMKRKLNVAIALLGDRKVVVLDEPTAGMDPHTRRQLWGLLKQCRTGRIMCLTTHYMDEADELGDRVAIMAGGRIVCCGTNTFLKRQLGSGYIISFVKKTEAVANGPIEMVVERHAGTNNDVGRSSCVGRELRIRVPFAAATGFPALMKDLDERMQEIGVESFGVGVSDLEDVFLRADALEEKPAAVSTQESVPPACTGGTDDVVEAATPEVSQRVYMEPTFFRQYIALMQRRVRYGSRDSRMCICQVVLPILIMLLYMVLSLRVVGKDVFRAMPLDAHGWSPEGTGLVSVGFAGDSPDGDVLKQVWTNSPPQGVTEVRTCANELLPSNTDPLNNTKQHAFGTCVLTAARAPGSSPQMGGVLYWENSVTIFPNTSAGFTAPCLLNLQFEEFMASQRSNSRAPFERLELQSQPLGLTSFESGISVKKNAIPVMMSVTVSMALAYIGAGIAAYATMERELDVHHQLMISGTGKLAYWLSNLVFDSFFGLTSFVGTVIILYVFSADDFFSYHMAPATVLLLFLFAPAAAAFGYAWSFLFKASGNSLVGVLGLTLFLSTIGLTVSELLIQIPEGGARIFGYILNWIIRILFPTTCVGHGLMNISVNSMIAKQVHLSAFSGFLLGNEKCIPGGEIACMVIAGDDIILLILDTLLYAALAYLGEIYTGNPHLFQLFKSKDPKCPKALKRQEDSRVEAERLRVKSLNPQGQVLMMDDVYKVYNGRQHAVRGITWAAEGGQVFGLLGANGAGKTTTFKMLCGQIAPSHGKVYVRGLNVQKNLVEARSLIGYCPQFSSLLDLLTVREHLELYGQVKGLSGSDLEAEVLEKTVTFNLQNFTDSRACQLSGGNARKLSTAIAVVAEPPVVLLDEPSAGMDPKARRFMWDVIQRIAQKRQDSVVILTTHSMDEADALCSRIAIQCSGQLRCLGTPQQLKEWYGSGLELNVRLEDPLREEVEALVTSWGISDEACNAWHVKQLVVKHAAGRPFDEIPLKSGDDTIPPRALAEWCLLQGMVTVVDEFLKQHCGASAVSRVETSAGTLRYSLTGNCSNGGPLPYGELFELLGEHGRSLRFVDFQVSQGTLEKTFNHIANEDMARWEQESLSQTSKK